MTDTGRFCKDKMILHDETRSIAEALVAVLEAKIVDYFGEVGHE